MTPDNIVHVVCQDMSVTKDELLGPSRTEPLALARHIAMYLMRELCHMSFNEIGRYFNRDHGTALHACARIRGLHPHSKHRARLAGMLQRAGQPAREQFKTLVGQHVLLAGDKDVFEAKVDRLSTNGDFVCLQVNGNNQWASVNKFSILDVLDRITTQEKQ